MTNTMTKNATIRPMCSISEEEGLVLLTLEMPGVTKDGVDIDIDGDTLTVKGSRPESEPGTYLIRERRGGDFSATYTLDERVDREKIDAKMERGVLELALHLRDEVKPRKIKVKTK